jgi:hypothetical protein
MAIQPHRRPALTMYRAGPRRAHHKILMRVREKSRKPP